MKRKINYIKFSTKSLNLLYLLNKRNKDIKNKTQLFKIYRFFFLNFNNYLVHFTENNIKISKRHNVILIQGLYRQVNLLRKYSNELPQYVSTNQDNKLVFNNLVIFNAYLSSIYSLYHLLLILNQNLYVINKI